MRIVCDTSIVMATLLNESSKGVIIENTRGCELISPETLSAEVGNAFTALFKRKKIDLENAIKGIEEFNKMKIQLMKIDLKSAIRVAKELGIYAYDAYMIELAKRVKCSLYTLDNPLNKKVKNFGLKIVEVWHVSLHIF